MKDIAQFLVFGFIGVSILYLALAMLPQPKKTRFRPSSKTHEEILKESETMDKRIRDREAQDIMDDYDKQEEYRRINGMGDEEWPIE
jgi:hypothetical protein